MDQMTCDKLMNVATFPDGKKFAFYNGLKHKIDHLKVDHAYDAMRLVGELKVVLDMFSNLLMSDPMLSSTSMDIMPTLDQLKIHATNALPMVTESSMEMINIGLMNLEPALGYDMVTEQDMMLAHDAFMPFLNRDVNNVPFDMLANDINNVNTMMNMGGGYMNGFDAHMLSNLEIYDRSADFVEAASIYQTVWDMMHMPAMPMMPPMGPNMGMPYMPPMDPAMMGAVPPCPPCPPCAGYMPPMDPAMMGMPYPEMVPPYMPPMEPMPA